MTFWLNQSLIHLWNMWFVEISPLGGKSPGGKQVVEMAGEVGGTTNDDPGPISQGHHTFWADSFFSITNWECYYAQHIIVQNTEF